MIPNKKVTTREAHIVKIAVELDNHIPQLINFDQRQPLTCKIQEICSTWGIPDPENYALQFYDQKINKYVTEKNRNEIKNGSVLRLRYSPSKTAHDILETLREGSTFEKVKCLKELVQLSMDLTFALEFIKEQGLTIIISMIEEKSQTDDILQYSLAGFVELMDHGTVSWEILQNNFVHRNVLIVCNFKNYPKECTESALSNLENIVHNCSKYSIVEKEVTLQDLLRLLQDGNSVVSKQNTIALINAIFLKADDLRKRQIAQTISAKPYRLALIAEVTGTEMTHQLYVLQTLTLGLLEQRMRMKFNSPGQEAQEKIKELRHIAFDDFTEDLNINERSTSNINIPQIYKKLGFKYDINTAQDLIETPPGILALDCMLYFAKNYVQQYTKIIHENTCRADDHECPFGHSSIELVKLLCDILRIGELPSEQSVDFQPMFFTHDSPFEEFFCICIMTLNRTWKDMRATAEDFKKVFGVVREQIFRSLKERPDNLEEFRLKMSQLTYQKITNLRQRERTVKEDYDSTESIVKLKEKITPHIIELIKKHRLSFLVQGTRFSKYLRGTRSKDKFWYARLSPNHKVIHFDDCDEKTVPALEELSNKVLVIDIKQLLEGKECPHMKEMRTRKSPVNLAFSITYDDKDRGTTLDFVAPDETIFNYWTDGINALLCQEMASKQKIEDFDTLLLMEIKLRLLDTEVVDISKDPPSVPGDPDNYDFCFDS